MAFGRVGMLERYTKICHRIASPLMVVGRTAMTISVAMLCLLVYVVEGPVTVYSPPETEKRSARDVDSRYGGADKAEAPLFRKSAIQCQELQVQEHNIDRMLGTNSGDCRLHDFSTHLR